MPEDQKHSCIPQDRPNQDRRQTEPTKEIQYFESEKKRIDEFLKLPVTDSEPVPDSEPKQPARYVVCPSCGLNYMKEGQSACDCCLRKK